MSVLRTKNTKMSEGSCPRIPLAKSASVDFLAGARSPVFVRFGGELKSRDPLVQQTPQIEDDMRTLTNYCDTAHDPSTAFEPSCAFSNTWIFLSHHRKRITFLQFYPGTTSLYSSTISLYILLHEYVKTSQILR